MKILSITLLGLLCFELSFAGLKMDKPGKGEKKTTPGEVLKTQDDFVSVLKEKELTNVAEGWARAGMRIENDLIDLLKNTEKTTLDTKKTTVDALLGLHTTVFSAKMVGDSISPSGAKISEAAKNLSANGLKMLLKDKSGSVNEDLLQKVTKLLEVSENDLKSEATSNLRVLEIEALLNGRKIDELLKCL